MNKERRDKISKKINMLETVKKFYLSWGIDEIKEFLENVCSDIEDICDDEQDAFDNMPEGLQCSMRGETAEECIDLLNDVMDLLNQLIETIDTAGADGVPSFEEDIDEVCDILNDVIYA